MLLPALTGCPRRAEPHPPGRTAPACAAPLAAYCNGSCRVFDEAVATAIAHRPGSVDDDTFPPESGSVSSRRKPTSRKLRAARVKRTPLSTGRGLETIGINRDQR